MLLRFGRRKLGGFRRRWKGYQDIWRKTAKASYVAQSLAPVSAMFLSFFFSDILDCKHCSYLLSRLLRTFAVEGLLRTFV
jgi:hypothetical protein